ncbi:MAG: hypothetical protein KDJ37_10930 [Hyphomicrobiaceae bacterium]|nr:hypothetical protein [Hyphomicrobiaceae bacterium]
MTPAMAGLRVLALGMAPALLVAFALVAGATGLPAAARAGALATDWVAGHNVESRLIAGGAPVARDDGSRTGNAASGAARLAGVEIALSPGWKTYWRAPGDAGGVPPSFDWSGSQNLARATVLYPAPQRMVDRAGTTIGYKAGVVLPVIVDAADPAQPVVLKLEFAFGVCREICVPSEASFQLEIPAANATETPDALKAAMARVPGPPTPDTPALTKVDIQLSADTPKIVLHVRYPGGVDVADLFVDEPGGEYVPSPVKSATLDDNTIAYEIDLTMGADVAALDGRTLTATMVSGKSQSEQQFKFVSK